MLKVYSDKFFCYILDMLDGVGAMTYLVLLSESNQCFEQESDVLQDISKRCSDKIVARNTLDYDC